MGKFQIAAWQYFRNNELKHFVVPGGCEKIGTKAFAFSTLESIEIAPTVWKIGMYAFGGLSFLKEIEIPEGVVVIDDMAFSDCVQLQRVLLPKSLIRVGRKLFSGCKSSVCVVVPKEICERMPLDEWRESVEVQIKGKDQMSEMEMNPDEVDTLGISNVSTLQEDYKGRELVESFVTDVSSAGISESQGSLIKGPTISENGEDLEPLVGTAKIQPAHRHVEIISDETPETVYKQGAKHDKTVREDSRMLAERVHINVPDCECSKKPIESLGLSKRVFVALKRGGVRTIGTLLSYSEVQLLRLPGIGQKALDEVIDKLETIDNGQLIEQMSLKDLPISNLRLKVDQSIETLGFSVQLNKILMWNGIDTVNTLAEMSREQLKKLSNVSALSVDKACKGVNEYLAKAQIRGETCGADKQSESSTESTKSVYEEENEVIQGQESYIMQAPESEREDGKLLPECTENASNEEVEKTFIQETKIPEIIYNARKQSMENTENINGETCEMSFIQEAEVSESVHMGNEALVEHTESISEEGEAEPYQEENDLEIVHENKSIVEHLKNIFRKMFRVGYNRKAKAIKNVQEKKNISEEALEMTYDRRTNTSEVLHEENETSSENVESNLTEALEEAHDTDVVVAREEHERFVECMDTIPEEMTEVVPDKEANALEIPREENELFAEYEEGNFEEVTEQEEKMLETLQEDGLFAEQEGSSSEEVVEEETKTLETIQEGELLAEYERSGSEEVVEEVDDQKINVPEILREECGLLTECEKSSPEVVVEEALEQEINVSDTLEEREFLAECEETISEETVEEVLTQEANASEMLEDRKSLAECEESTSGEMDEEVTGGEANAFETLQEENESLAKCEESTFEEMVEEVADQETNEPETLREKSEPFVECEESISEETAETVLGQESNVSEVPEESEPLAECEENISEGTVKAVLCLEANAFGTPEESGSLVECEESAVNEMLEKVADQETNEPEMLREESEPLTECEENISEETIETVLCPRASVFETLQESEALVECEESTFDEMSGEVAGEEANELEALQEESEPFTDDKVTISKKTVEEVLGKNANALETLQEENESVVESEESASEETIDDVSDQKTNVHEILREESKSLAEREKSTSRDVEKEVLSREASMLNTLQEANEPIVEGKASIFEETRETVDKEDGILKTTYDESAPLAEHVENISNKYLKRRMMEKRRAKETNIAYAEEETLAERMHIYVGNGELSKMPIESLKLSVRAFNALRRGGVHTIMDILSRSETRIAKFSCLGQKTVKEIIEKLEDAKKVGWFLSEQMNAKIVDSPSVEQISLDDPPMSSLRLKEDLSVEVLKLSARPRNRLKKYTINALAEMSLKQLMELENLGKQSVCEVHEKLVTYLVEAQKCGETCTEEHASVEEKLPSFLTEFIAAFCRSFSEVSQGNVKLQAVQVWKTLGTPSEMNVAAFTEAAARTDFFTRVMRKKLRSSLEANKFDGISESELVAALPEGWPRQSLEDVLQELESKNELRRRNGFCFPVLETLDSYLLSIPDERARFCMTSKLQGETLESIAQTLGLTRERIRQIIAKAMRKYFPKLLCLEEDRYATLYEKYALELAEFRVIFQERTQTYKYLQQRYRRGVLPLNYAVDDASLSRDLRAKIRDHLESAECGYLTVNGRHILLKRSDLMEYVLKTGCRDAVDVDEFIEQYNHFLHLHGVENERLYIPVGAPHYIEGRLSEKRQVLWSLNRRLRFYDIDAGDYTELLQTLDLGAYHDIEISTRKFMLDYPQLMQRYDIRDEYELHNLLKKIGAERENDTMSFGRMPMLSFGNFDRAAFMQSVLAECAPCDRDTLTRAVSERVGVLPETVGAVWLPCVDTYYYKGVYTIDSPEMPEAEEERLRAALTEDAYTLEEIARLYRRAGGTDGSLLTPYNLKRLGFLVYSSFAVRNAQNASDYFSRKLTETDVVDYSELQRRFSTVQVFSFRNVLNALKNSYEVIEFEPYQLIQLRKLQTYGIDRPQLQAFCDDVAECVQPGELFTMQLLRGRGQEFDLDALGFGDTFYNSLLREDERFDFGRMDNKMLFRRRVPGDEPHQLLRAELAAWVLREEESMDIDEMSEIICQDFGLKIEKYDLKAACEQAGLYWDSIMNRVYQSYDIYYDEV